jgi:hypothetical protein
LWQKISLLRDWLINFNRKIWLKLIKKAKKYFNVLFTRIMPFNSGKQQAGRSNKPLNTFWFCHKPEQSSVYGNPVSCYALVRGWLCQVGTK